MLVSMLVPISVLLANVANFVTQLLVPQFLPANEYSAFATLWAYGQLVAVVVFEWMRLSVLRFSESVDEGLAAIRRRTLFLCYSAAVVCLVLLSLAAFLLRDVSIYYKWASAVSLYALGQGVFDGRQALARAQFRNGSFSVAWILRSGFTLGFALFFSVQFSDGPLVLVGLALAYLLVAILFGFKELKSVDFSLDIDFSQVGFLTRYGAFVAISSSIAAALPAVVRSLLLDAFPGGGAGGSMLALDLSQKALAVVGMVVNVVILQKSIKASEFGSLEQKATQMSRHVAMTAATILPAAVLFFEIQPVLVKWLVPAGYLESYMSSVGLATFGAMLLCFRQFSIDTLFVVIGKSTLSIVGPISAMVVTVVLFYVLRGYVDSPELLVCGCMVAGLFVGVVLSVLAVRSIAEICWPVKDLLVTLVGCALISFCIRLVAAGPGHVLLQSALGLLAALLAYGGLAFTCNLCGVREKLSRKGR